MAMTRLVTETALREMFQSFMMPKRSTSIIVTVPTIRKAIHTSCISTSDTTNTPAAGGLSERCIKQKKKKRTCIDMKKGMREKLNWNPIKSIARERNRD